MKKTTKADKVAKRREYQKGWYEKRMAAKRAAKQTAPIATQVIPDESNHGFIHIINAYYVLHSATKNQQIISDLNKVLAAIITSTQK